MSEDFEPIALRKAIELEHDRRIKRGDVAMPDVARDAGEKDVGVTAFERLRQRQLGNAVSLSEVFAEKQTVDPRRAPAHDHVLRIVRKGQRLNEATWTCE